MRLPSLIGLLLAGLTMCASGVALAHDPDEQELEVPEVSVRVERPVAASSQQFIPDKEIVLQPQGRPAQILRLIPGFVAVEHSGGGGKADQYFLRGFDADHGTDVGFSLDGMPINLRTHAHGQGYTDLNFIIPETVEGIDVHKGSYMPEHGDFVTAGAVNFRTRDMVKEGVVQGAGGEYRTQRYLLMLSPTKDRVRTLFAAEGFYTNGPYLNDNQYHRANVFGKATTNVTGRDELSLQATFHQSRWDGSGEIPFRAVSTGLVDRFGSINPYEGGNTLRSTAQLKYHYDTLSGGEFFANVYGQYYRMDLFTDFTFFLNNPVNGDGFAQFDRRAIYGGDIGYKQRADILGLPVTGTVGFQTRIDDAHVKLGTQTRRTPTGTTIDSNAFTVSYSPFVKAEVHPLSWLRFSGGVRGEFFTFDVNNRCTTCAEQPNGRRDSGLVLPKMSMILGPWMGTEFFANYGEGFHSNDARSVVTGGASPQAKARSYEVGVRSKPWGPEGLELIATVWRLDLKSELVFVGDEGTTEIRGGTRRQGVEVAARGKLWGPLYVNGSVTWTHAEFRNGDAIPLAPEYTAYGAAILQWPEGLTSQLQATYLGVRPLTEDRSVKSPSWLTFDLSERYRLPITLPHGRMEAFLFVQNLLNADWEQAIFAFPSRLRNETSGVNDIHFVPGTPRTVMGGLAWYF